MYFYTYINRFIYVPAPHTVDALAEILYDSLCDWNLDRKLSTLTVDNCTTNDAIISKLLDNLPLRSLDNLPFSISKLLDNLPFSI